MLIKNFYQVLNKEHREGNNFIEILINKDHEIFKGHFPGNPAMPGVCMLQIIKELTEEMVSSKLFMHKCVNVKFLALINPDSNPELKLSIKISGDHEIVKVNSTTKFDDTIALKMSAHYKRVE